MHSQEFLEEYGDEEGPIEWKKANPEKNEEARWAECGVGPLRIMAEPGAKARLVMRTKIGKLGEWANTV